MFKTETHLHTSDVSRCGRVYSVNMVKLYHEAGYKTLFVTDHLYQTFVDRLEGVSWQDKMTIFFSGYYRAKNEAKKYGMNVIMSAEITFECNNNNHYLVYGITKEFMDSCEDLCKMKPQRFYEIAKANGVLVIQAHPFRDEVCFPTPDCVDGMEIFNSSPSHENFNDKCKKYASENNMLVSAGSDSHRVEDVAKAGILSENEIKSAQDFIELIKSGKAVIYEGE